MFVLRNSVVRWFEKKIPDKNNEEDSLLLNYNLL